MGLLSLWIFTNAQMDIGGSHITNDPYLRDNNTILNWNAPT